MYVVKVNGGKNIIAVQQFVWYVRSFARFYRHSCLRLKFYQPRNVKKSILVMYFRVQHSRLSPTLLLLYWFLFSMLREKYKRNKVVITKTIIKQKTNLKKYREISLAICRHLIFVWIIAPIYFCP